MLLQHYLLLSFSFLVSTMSILCVFHDYLLRLDKILPQNADPYLS